jgi:transcriptional regulator with XRE-family HTH domain
MRRGMMRMSQRQLAEQLGIAVQQVQKYESGATRISAGRLYQIAQIMNVPVWFFFDESDPARDASQPLETRDRAEADFQPAAAAELSMLIVAFTNITEPSDRQLCIKLVQRLSKT